MNTFEFTVVASGLDTVDGEVEDRFFEAGCDDATISWQKGAILLDFAREADDLSSAIKSAMVAVRKAGARVERIEPDPLVSLAEIAVRAGLTRAAVSHYAAGERGIAFPGPISRVTTQSPLWDWAAVAGWLHDNGRIGAETVARAREIRTVNLSLAAANLSGADRAA